MKPIFVAILLLGTFFTFWLAAEDSLSMKIQDNVFRITVGKKEETTSTTRDLQERIYALERAVYQLQNKVYHLSERKEIIILPSKEAPKTVSCYIETTFDGTFTGTGATKAEAKGKALKACNEESSSMWCRSDKLKCDK